MSVKFDLIRTIDDDETVPNFSEDSNDEDEFQPHKQKKMKQIDFDTDFKFVDSVAEYNADTWDDVAKYIKKKGKTKVDDKIEKARREMKKEKKPEENGEDPPVVHVSDTESEKSDEEIELSEDELKKDDIKVKTKALSKRKKKHKLNSENDDMEENKQSEFFEEAPPFDENASFYQMNLSKPLLKAITAMNFIHPTPIQAATIPVALLGRDICGCAATGTGKTAAYALPILERLLFRPLATAETKVLVLVPTRELGVQVYQVFRQLAQFTNIEVGLSVGGLEVKIQEGVLRRNPDIVIATPGRLIDHLQNTPTFSLSTIEVLVLDEADRLLDEYFAEQLKEIINFCSRTRQSLLFSATMTEGVEELAAVSLNKPVKIFVDNNQVVAFNLRQEFIRIRAKHEDERESILAALICRTFHDHTLVFVHTKKQAHEIHILLGLLGIKCGELHGNLKQPQRLEALRKFKNEEVDVLLATDLAARGLDISGVKTVINFVMPSTVEQYIHRVGRTARAGRAGIAVSLIGEGDRKLVKSIVKKATNPVKMRLIPIDIIQKYKSRVNEVKKKVVEILKEEHEERELTTAEIEANRAEDELKGNKAEAAPPRTWFQTAKERKKVNEKLQLSYENKKNKRKRDDDDDKRGKKKAKHGKQGRTKQKDSREDAEKAKIDKAITISNRIAKKKARPKKIRAYYDRKDENSAKKGAKKHKSSSSFAKDLTDVSQKGAKRMRYEANFKQKMDKLGSNKGGAKKGFGQKGPGQKFAKNKFNQKKNQNRKQFNRKKGNKKR